MKWFVAHVEHVGGLAVVQVLVEGPLPAVDVLLGNGQGRQRPEKVVGVGRFGEGHLVVEVVVEADKLLLFIKAAGPHHGRRLLRQLAEERLLLDQTAVADEEELHGQPFGQMGRTPRVQVGEPPTDGSRPLAVPVAPASRSAPARAIVDPRRMALSALSQGQQPQTLPTPSGRTPRPGGTRALGVGDNGGMPRAIWSGSISFGLVNVPVKLYSAISPKDVRFNQLEEGTGARIRQKRVSAETGEEVPYERIVKGYEISPDRYVIITPEELEGLDPKATRAIDIEDFVEYDQIDPVHYERPYYLVPEKGAAKAYALLLQAMKDSNKVAIARLVLRTKQYLAAIRPKGDVLCLETMLFADEVVPESELDGVPGDDVEVSERELKMARQLIESLSTDFEPEKYQRRVPASRCWPSSRQGRRPGDRGPARQRGAGSGGRPHGRPGGVAGRRPGVEGAKDGVPSGADARRSTVEGRTLKLSNLDKVLYPDVGFTKGQVIDYYTRIAPVLLPHLAGRPLTLKRYPNGVDGGVLLREAVSLPPPAVGPDRPGVERPQPADHRLLPGQRPPHPGVGGQPGLSRAAHRPAPGARARASRLGRLRPRPGRARRPGRVRPGGPLAAGGTRPPQAHLGGEDRRAARAFSSTFPSTPRPPTTTPRPSPWPWPRSSSGPTPRRWCPTWPRTCARERCSSTGARTTSTRPRCRVYSLRARPRPTVSAPLHWEEVEAIQAGGDPGGAVDAPTALERVAGDGDLFAPLLTLEQRLPNFSTSS